jgi:23S rRNA (uracil1939-C5)-methyltransferase
VNIDPEPEPSSESTDARCPHFGECGGCSTQHVPYPDQVAEKGGVLGTLFESFWSQPIPVEPSPVSWHYRNKLDLNFGRKHYPEPPPKDFPRETVLGFKRAGKWFWTLDIEECHIGPEGAKSLLTAVRQWARERSLTAFSSKARDGFLRILLVREGKRTGQRMVVLITNEGELDAGSFVQAVQPSFPCHSILHAQFRGRAEIAAADWTEVLYGNPTIDEVLEVPDASETRLLRFRLSPFSFFQTNTYATEKLYGFIRAWVKESRPRFLYDLYGGSGGIALSCSDRVDRVVSVESIEDASIDGTHNAEVNGADNVVFITQTVEDYLRDTLHVQKSFQPNSLVIVDPPRAGLHPKALKRLVALHPPEIIYVSCKPAVLAGEMPTLLAHYDLVGMQAVDMFPHTEHVELLARFRRK